MKDEIPKVAVLLAAYNGAEWIEEQLHSISGQADVDIDVFVSLDCSSDTTKTLLEDFVKLNNDVKLLPYGDEYGTAARNFYRLIRDVDVGSYDFVSFSDQDDIWLSSKILTAIRVMKATGACAYSSDAIAFWKDGKQKKIKKSYPQKKYDFLFESGGPGCTYVFASEKFQEFKSFVAENWTTVQSIEHDWLAYAFFRARKLKWCIDTNSLLLYRQHDKNQFGANVSWATYASRFKLIKNGWYKQQVVSISQVLGIPEPTKKFITLNFTQTRRKTRDTIIMLFLSFFFKR